MIKNFNNEMGTLLDFGDWGNVDYQPSAKIVNAAQNKLGSWGLDWLFKPKAGTARPTMDPKQIMMIAGGIGAGILLLVYMTRPKGVSYAPARPRPRRKRRAPAAR